MLLHPACVQASFSAADERLAAQFHRRGVALIQLRRAIWLGCARKNVALLDSAKRWPRSGNVIGKAITDCSGWGPLAGFEVTREALRRIAFVECLLRSQSQASGVHWPSPARTDALELAQILIAMRAPQESIRLSRTFRPCCRRYSSTARREPCHQP